MTIPHDSDCAIHNGPGLEPAVCDCSLSMLKNAIRNAAKTDITIPPAALEAASFAVGAFRYSEKHTSEDIARAACLAMLRAWPGMEVDRYTMFYNVPMREARIILPLTENPND